jgi:hypothetical protein
MQITTLLCLLLWSLSQAMETRAEVVLVVNPSVALRELAPTAVRAIFGIRLRNWPNGEPIRVFVLPDDSPVHAQFFKQKLAIFPHQLRLAWNRLEFAGIGQAPTTVLTQPEMRAHVATTTGAIGYLSKEMVDSSVRMVEIRR